MREPTTELCFLNDHGNLTPACQHTLPSMPTRESLLTWYRHLHLTRAFEDTAYNLQRTGRLGTFPGSRGQEALYTALGQAMADDDVLCPYYREHATFLWRGMPAWQILQYWGGDERAMAFSHRPQDLPICVPIGSQCPHGVGVALALKIQKKPHVAVISLGDGATSTGDFYESINMAGLKKLPVTFIINNNRLAISTPLNEQTANPNLADKASLMGIKVYRVDGCDIIASHHVIQQALHEARTGQPTLVEAMTYRLCDHTTADDASRYLDEDYLDHARQADPLMRLEYYLRAQGWLDDHQQQKLIADIEEYMAEQRGHYLNLTPASVSEIFDYQYQIMPQALRLQRQQCEEASHD